MKEIFLQQLKPGSIGSAILSIAVLSIFGFAGSMIAEILGYSNLKPQIGTAVKVGAFLTVIVQIGLLFAELGKLTSGSMF